MNSAWRNLLVSILSRGSGVTSWIVATESWRTRIGWMNPACDLCLFRLRVYGMVRSKVDFLNVHSWMNLKKLSAFARAHENLFSRNWEWDHILLLVLCLLPSRSAWRSTTPKMLRSYTNSCTCFSSRMANYNDTECELPFYNHVSLITTQSLCELSAMGADVL